MQLTWDTPSGPYDLVLHGNTLLPLPANELWETAVRAAQDGHVVGVLPPLPQYIPRLLGAVRSQGKPLIVFPPEKSLGALALMRELPVAHIFAEAKDMPGLHAAMLERSVADNVALHCILAPTEAPLPGNFLHEVHLVPSMVILYQCTHLASLNAPHFHPSARFEWSVENQTAFVTDKAGRFTHYPLPHKAALAEKSCPCGESCTLLYT